MVERLFPALPNPDPNPVLITQLLAALHAGDRGDPPAGVVDDWPPDLLSTVRATLRAASPMAVLIGREGVVICNAAAQGLLGDAFEAAQGRSIFELLPGAGDFCRTVIEAAHLGRSLYLRDQQIDMRRDGSPCTGWFNFSSAPIIDGEGRVLGTWLIGSETTGHVRTRNALNLAYQRMEIALEACGIVGTCDVDVASRKVIVDGSLAAQYGVGEAEARNGIPLEAMTQVVHPDDRADLLAALDQAASEGRPLHSRFRVADGTDCMRWYMASGRPVRDEGGAIVAVVGILIDVTGQTEAAAALRHSNLRFDTLVGAIPQIVWSSDGDGVHDYFNSRWSEFTGIAADRILPDMWTGMIHPDDAGRVAAAWQECLATGKTYDIDYRFRRHDGVYRWLRVTAMPMRDCDGNILRWYGTSTDIDDAKQLDARRELVNRELDHRIKNLFALVNGLVGLAAREEPGFAPFADTLRARLAALHRAHELIRGRPGCEGSSFRRLLGELLAPFMLRDADTVAIGGGDVFVRPEAITSMALIFHELATNTAKYGALKDPRGRLLISLDRRGDRLDVRWEERFANDATATPAASGFGSKLLDALVARQLGGAWKRDYSPEGLVIALRLPSSLFDDDAP